MKPVEQRAENRTTLPLEVAGWSPMEGAGGAALLPRESLGWVTKGGGSGAQEVLRTRQQRT